MRRCLAGALVAILGACAWQLRPQAPPALTTARVRLTAGQRVTSAPIKSVGITHPPLAVALGQIDLAPTGRWVAGLRTSQAIEWASGLAHAQDQRRFVMDHHAPTVPSAAGAYTTWPDWPLWHCTMLHESGGSWTFQTRAFAGAFAIARTTWAAFGGEYARRWPNAAAAPPDQQILGARLVRAHVGSGQWGGLAKCGG